MKPFILTFPLLLLATLVFAQEECHPVRTPEEEALKQTEMLQIELDLSEYQYDTIYRIHLKHARMRQVSNTRAEVLQRMRDMTDEILGVLTKTQQQLFLNKQMAPPSSDRVRMQCMPRNVSTPMKATPK